MGSVGVGTGCGPELPGSLPSTGLALQKEGQSGWSQPAATSLPHREARCATLEPEPSLWLSIALFALD